MSSVEFIFANLSIIKLPHLAITKSLMLSDCFTVSHIGHSFITLNFYSTIHIFLCVSKYVMFVDVSFVVVRNRHRRHRQQELNILMALALVT